MSSEDDDVPVANLAAVASGTSDSEVDWIKDWKPTVAAGSSSPTEGTSTSDSEGFEGVDDEKAFESAWATKPALEAPAEEAPAAEAPEPNKEELAADAEIAKLKAELKALRGESPLPPSDYGTTQV